MSSPAAPAPAPTPEAEAEAGARTDTGTGAGSRPDTSTGTGAGTRPDTSTGGRTDTSTDSSAGTGSAAGAGDAERPTGRIRRALFRRNRAGATADPEQTGTVDTGKSESKQRESKGRNRTDEPVPARDEEYVDWVSGLSEPDPAADDLGLDRSVRRSLRSTGRHAAD